MLVFRNIFRRLINAKEYLVLSFAVIFISVFIVTFTTTLSVPKYRVGVLESANEIFTNNSINSNNRFEFEKVNSNKDYNKDLIVKKYDAYISKENDEFHITEISNNKIALQLEMLLFKNSNVDIPKSDTDYKTMLSVITMTSMIITLVLYKFYFDDKSGVHLRIRASKNSTLMYILQYIFFNFLTLISFNILSIFLVLPYFHIVISTELLIFSSLGMLFAATFGMFLSTYTKKNQGALLIGTMLTVISTLLSGSLFAVKENSLQSKIQYLFPQKYIAELGNYLNDKSINIVIPIVILVLYIIILFTCSIKRYNKIFK